jgi:hypothetical protein
LFFRSSTLAVAVGCVALLAPGCTGPAPAATPTADQLLASAVAGLRGGHPCTVGGEIVVGSLGAYASVSSMSAGDRFSATITKHLPGAQPFTVPESFIDDGAALYLQSAKALQLGYERPVPAGLSERWIRFPSWPALGHDAFDAESEKMTQYPGLGGQAVFELSRDSIAVPYEGGSCGLLAAQLRVQRDQSSRVVSGRLDGRPVLDFTLQYVFGYLIDVQYQVTVSSGTPVRVLRVTGGGHVLSLGYPATIEPISAPPADDVIPAEQLPGLLGSN